MPYTSVSGAGYSGFNGFKVIPQQAELVAPKEYETVSSKFGASDSLLLINKKVMEDNYGKIYREHKDQEGVSLDDLAKGARSEASWSLLDEVSMYDNVATRFNGSQYGYKSTIGMNPRGATWFDVSNASLDEFSKSISNLSDDIVNSIAKSSVSGYQPPKTGKLDAIGRILAKSNDTIPSPKVSKTNPTMDPAGFYNFKNVV